MKKDTFAPGILALLLLSGSIFSFSESDAVLFALEKSTEFRIVALDRTADSLSFEYTRADWFPSVDLSVEQELGGSDNADFPSLDSADYESSYGIAAR
ncbi:MAG: hypothetical protein GF350_08060, partial [Chitinivibrionales bacterium]|nr:hypothetical protein [Chitinivibrionales bacterium]